MGKEVNQMGKMSVEQGPAINAGEATGTIVYDLKSVADYLGIQDPAKLTNQEIRKAVEARGHDAPCVVVWEGGNVNQA
jgi:hypothetical protein